MTLLIILFMFLTSCGTVSYETETPSPFPTRTQSPTAPPTSTPSPSPTPKPAITLCSPIEGMTMGEISQYITQPFIAPSPRKDDGHQGIDIAFFAEGDRPIILGLSIHSILPGRVAAVLTDKGPYGNMIIIETSLEELPEVWLKEDLVPTVAPTVTSDGRLSCPEKGDLPVYDTNGNRSLYILYAHLQNPPDLKVDDTVTSCQVIGQVGNTGWSSDPHLHLETRFGPSNAIFGEIVHRVPATLEQTHNYCVWRISNLFQLVDPQTLLFFALE